MKIKLSVADRMNLIGVLPAEGNYATQKVVRDLRDRIGFEEGELKAIDYKQVGDRAHWDVNKAKEKEYEFGKYETEVIVEALEQLDKEEKLTAQTTPLYEKFIK
jgi:hypothetical protein